MNKLHAIAEQAARCGAHVEIIGAWVWASFDTKPDEETRYALKCMDFHWNKKRECWQYAGTPSGPSRYHRQVIAQKYGVQVIEETVNA